MLYLHMCTIIYSAHIYIYASQQRSESVNWDHPTGLMKISPKIEQFFLYHDVFVGFTIFYLKTC